MISHSHEKMAVELKKKIKHGYSRLSYQGYYTILYFKNSVKVY